MLAVLLGTWLVGTLALAIVLSTRRPLVAFRVGRIALDALLVSWALTCGLGILAQLSSESGSAFHSPHDFMGRVVLTILLWTAFLLLVPVAIERAARAVGGGLMLVLHLFAALASLALGLATGFTGYLADGERSGVHYERFVLLHVWALPVLTTACLVAWRILVARYPRTFSGTPGTAART